VEDPSASVQSDADTRLEHTLGGLIDRGKQKKTSIFPNERIAKVEARCAGVGNSRKHPRQALSNRDFQMRTAT